MIILVKLRVGVNDLFVDEKMKIIGWGETEPGREDINLKYGDVVGFSNEVTYLPRNAHPFRKKIPYILSYKSRNFGQILDIIFSIRLIRESNYTRAYTVSGSITYCPPPKKLAQPASKEKFLLISKMAVFQEVYGTVIRAP